VFIVAAFQLGVNDNCPNFWVSNLSWEDMRTLSRIQDV